MSRIPSVAALLFALWLPSLLCVAQSSRENLSKRPPAASQDLVDINHATLEQLLKAPGLTRSWAERILRFRPYRSKLELVQDGVLPVDIYNRIREHIIAHREQQ